MANINIGIVGTGISYMMALAAKEIDGVDVCAVYSRTLEKGKEFADKLNIERVYTDYQAMLNDENINFIYVASPNSLHYSQAKQAILKRKNVIVEKPFCSNYAEANELIDLAEEKDVYLFEAITVLHSPNYKLLQEKIKEIGKVKQIQCCYCQYSRKYQDLLNGKTPNVFSLQYSGGALMDLNIYNIHFVVGLYGEPNRTTYFCRKHGNGVDLGGTIIMEYDDMIVECLAAKDVKADNRNILVGDKGYITVDGGSNGKKAFTVCVDENKDHYNQDNDLNWLCSEMKDFYNIYCNDDKASMYSLWENTKIAMKVVDQAKKSADLAAW